MQLAKTQNELKAILEKCCFSRSQKIERDWLRWKKSAVYMQFLDHTKDTNEPKRWTKFL